MAKSPILTLLALFFGAVAFGFGVNAILKPASEIAMFELTSLAATADPVLIDALMTAFGAKLLGAAAAIFSTAYFGSRKALGCVVLAGGLVAGVDGWVCLHYVGTGEWNHWGYGSAMVVLGGLLVGGW